MIKFNVTNISTVIEPRTTASTTAEFADIIDGALGALGAADS